MERLTYTCPKCGEAGRVALLGITGGSFAGRCHACRRPLVFTPTGEGRAEAQPQAEPAAPAIDPLCEAAVPAGDCAAPPLRLPPLVPPPAGPPTGPSAAPPKNAPDGRPDSGASPNGLAPGGPYPDGGTAASPNEPVPPDYPPYRGPVMVPARSPTRGHLTITILLFTASLLGFYQAWGFHDLPNTIEDEGEVEVTLVVRNSTGPLDNATLKVDGQPVNLTRTAPGRYTVTLTTGVRRLEIAAPGHHSAWTEVIIMESSMGVSGGEGFDRFTFTLTPGTGEARKVKMEVNNSVSTFFEIWCPALGVLLSLGGLGGAWAAYGRRSYRAAVVGALCALFAVGFFIGSALALAALILLFRRRTLFPGAFNTGNPPPPWS